MVQKFVKGRNNNSLQSDNESSGEAYAVEQVETLAAEIACPTVRPVRNHTVVKGKPESTQPRRTAKEPQQSGNDACNRQNSFLAAPARQEQGRRTFAQQPAKARSKEAATTPGTPQEQTRSTYSRIEQMDIRKAAQTPKLRQTCICKESMAKPSPTESPASPIPQAQMQQTFPNEQAQFSQNPSIKSTHLCDPAMSQPPLSDTLGVGGESVSTASKQTQPLKKQQAYIAAQRPISQEIRFPSEKPASALPQIREKVKPNAAPKEKPRRGIVVKTRETVSSNISGIQADTTSAIPQMATAKARQHAIQEAQHKMLKKSSRAAKTAVAIGKRITEAAARAGKTLVGALAGLGGSMAVLLLLCIPVVAGAVLASPLGILFADKQQTPDTVPLATAIAEIQGEYHTKLENLQSGNFTSVLIVGQAPDWREVAAVFASKTAGSEDGTDVFTLDAAHVELLRQVFWDMCQINTWTDTTQNETGETKIACTIAVTAKSAEQMRLEYHFSKYQNDALDILLENLCSLNVPLGSLTISQEDAIALLENLPDDLDPARKAVVETAIQLVGKVTYFWGGKSLTLGWDDRWGMPMEVTAAGSGSTGTVRPFGLDCSGFVDWAFYNATNGAYYPGHGGGAATQHAYCTNISWSETQPGDLVFYPDDSHVGIVGSADADGNLLVIHCSGGANGVVITGSAGFTAVARPVSWPE